MGGEAVEGMSATNRLGGKWKGSHEWWFEE